MLKNDAGIKTESKPTHAVAVNWRQVWIKSSLLSLLIAALMLLLTVVIVAGWAYSKFSLFAKVSQISKAQLKQTLVEGWQTQVINTDQYKNILVLGLDSLQTRSGSAPLTDTMLLVSLNLSTGKIKTLPLPRDLWHQPYQTKINALYTYGLERSPEQPALFAQETIAKLIGLPIHHTLVFSIENVADIINLLGGIEVEVKQGFVDEKFPRTDIDVTVETDPEKLYETVEFVAGAQTMDGGTALKYMRSRHGDNKQNTDDARLQRQQAIIQALVGKLLSQQVVLDPRLAGQIYRYYLDSFAVQLPATELIATLKQLWPVRKQMQVQSARLGVYPDEDDGVVEHPSTELYDGQWVYTIRDEVKFQQRVQSIMLE